MRIAGLALSLLICTHAHADILGLKLKMTEAEAKAAKLCKAPVADTAKYTLTCKSVAFAGTKMDVELWIPKPGLAKIGMSTKIGAARKEAEAKADAILEKLTATYGKVEMTGNGELSNSAPLFDNVDKTFARFKHTAATMFTVDDPPDKTMRLIGKVIHDTAGYWMTLSFVPHA